MQLCSALQTTPNYLLLGAVNEYTESEFDAAALTAIRSMNNTQKQLALSLFEWIATQKKYNINQQTRLRSADGLSFVFLFKPI